MPFQKAIEILNQYEPRKLCRLVYKNNQGDRCALGVLFSGIEALAQELYCPDLGTNVADPFWKLADLDEVRKRLEELEMSWLEAEELQKVNDFDCMAYAPELRYTMVMQWLVQEQTRIDLGTRSTSFL